MNPLFEELLAQPPGYTPPMGAAPTVASTGGTVAQPLTPAGQAIGGGILHGLMYPGEALQGRARVFDDEGHVTEEAANWGAERALGMMRAANIPRTPVAPNEVAFGSGPLRAYQNVPDSLMGFRRNGPNKGFHETNFPHEQPVQVTFPDSGDTFTDAIRGLNEAHAMERARRNWPDALIEILRSSGGLGGLGGLAPRA